VILRWLATAAIVALLALDLFIPGSVMGRRGNEAAARDEVPGAARWLGRSLPDLDLLDLEGRPLALSDFRGHRVLLAFERSVDW